MGFQSLFASPAVRAVAAVFALANALVLSSCLSDGVNHAGEEYLADHGLVLQTPVYRVNLPAFEADSVWLGELEPNRLGDSVLMMGRWSRFSSQVRLGFDVADTSFLDSLEKPGDADSARSLKLSLGFPYPKISFGPFDAAATGRDSVALIVEAWAIPDTGWPSDKRSDSLYAYNRRFLIRQDTTSILPPVTLTDTVTVKIDSLYPDSLSRGDSVQAFALPRLREKLRSLPAAKWLVFLQITPRLPAGDSSPFMLRIAGNLGSLFQPSLLFGSVAGSEAAAATQRLGPLVVSQAARYGMNYKLRYSGPGGNLLAGRTRGLHLRLDRAKLLDSIRKYLPDSAARAAGSGQNGFDLSYFVPYAQISLPVDTGLSIEGGFALDMRAVSNMDSLVPAVPGGTAPLVNLPLNWKKLIVYVMDKLNSSVKADSLYGSYRPHPLDPNLRQAIIYSAKDSTLNDTVTLAVGETREISRRPSGYGNNLLVFSLSAEAQNLRVVYFVDTRPQVEQNEFRDPATGQNLTELSAKQGRYLQLGQSAVTLRTTAMFQAILNRTASGASSASIRPDILVQPVERGAIDLPANQRVPYNVLADIPVKKSNGKVAVDIVLFLFPLGQR